MNKKSSLHYLGKLSLCLIITAIVGYNESYIKSIISSVITTNNGVLSVLLYCIGNVISLILGDIIIFILSDKEDGAKYWKTEYKKLEKSYLDLKDKTKTALHYFISLFNSEDLKINKKDIINNINSMSEHISEADISIMRQHCNNIHVTKGSSLIDRFNSLNGK